MQSSSNNMPLRVVTPKGGALIAVQASGKSGVLVAETGALFRVKPFQQIHEFQLSLFEFESGGFFAKTTFGG